MSLILLGLTAGEANAQSTAPQSAHQINIERSSLNEALTQIARHTGVQVAHFSDSATAEILVGPLSGLLTLEQALASLLAGSGLAYRFVNERTVAIVKAPGVEVFTDVATSGAEPANVVSNSRPQGWFARFVALFAACGSLTSTAVCAQESATAVLEEVVVTGTRLQAAGFNAPTPVTVVTAETIQQRAPANIADVINEQPAFRLSQSDTTRNAGGLPQQGQNTLDLRALGGNRTLVLINGHRAVGTNWTGTVDTNIVPVGLVERIETVTGGASAAYGSDAVAGVTNIILRNKMQGITANAQMGLTEYGSGKQYTAAVAGGTAFANDRANVIVGIDYNKSEAIKDAYGTKWGAAEIGNIQPSAAQRTAQGLPQTVIATNVQPGTSAPGGLLYQNTIGGLAWTFDSNGNPVPFSQGTLWGAQQFMTGSNANYGYNTGNVSWLRIPTSRVDAYGRLSYEMTDRITAFLEVSNSSNEIGPFKQNDVILGTNVNQLTPALTISRTNTFVTPATLALIPAAATTFTIGRINTEFGPYGGGGYVKQEIDSHRIVAGLEGAFLDDWNWEVYYQSGRTKLDLKRNDWSFQALQKAVNGCNTSVGFNAQALADLARYEAISGKTCTPFNPFGVGRNPASATNYFINATRHVEHIEQDVIAASLSGSPFAVPAGDVALAAGAEYRREHIDADSDPVSEVGSILVGNLVQFFGGYDVKEAFLEVGVPVVKDLPFARTLDLNAAVRRTDYELSGAVTTWKTGLTWEPTDTLRVRYTRSRDIRAPNLFELFLVGGNAQANVANRIPSGVVGRNGTVNVNPYQVPGFNLNNAPAVGIIVPGSGGGLTLVPEIADTSTGGIVFQTGGFHVSADYYKIKLNGAIAGVGGQQTVDLCRDGDAKFCDAIIFDSTVQGGIRLVESRMYNINKQTLSGYDLEVGYRLPLLGGNFSVRALVNYQPHNKTYNPIAQTATGPGQTTENANTLGNQPKLGYNLSLGYDANRYNVNVQVRGFTERRGNSIIYNSDGSLSTNTVLGPEDAGYNPANANTINRNRWPGQFTVNPSVSFKVNEKFSVFGNIDNLFDVGPPTLSTSNVYDLIGRRYRAGMRFSML